RKPPALTAAERAVEKSDKARSDRAEILEKAGKRAASAQTLIEELSGQRKGLLTRLRSHPDPAALATKIEQVEGSHEALADARQSEDDARTRHKEAQAAAETARAKMTAAWKTFDMQRDPLVALGPPAPERRDLLMDWTAL